MAGPSDLSGSSRMSGASGQSPTPKNMRNSIKTITVILAAAALIGGGIWFRIQSNKKEAEAEALRREKRRQRLVAEGGDAEAEFNRLLEEKRKRNEGRRKR